MEQLGIDWKLLGAQIINFLILLYLLKRFVFGSFFATLQKRRETIEEGVHKTEEASKRLEQLSRVEAQMKERGEQEAKKVLQEAHVLAQKKEQQALLRFEEEKKKRAERARKDLEAELERERTHFDEQLTDYVFAITEKFLGEKTGASQDKKIITNLIAKEKKTI